MWRRLRVAAAVLALAACGAPAEGDSANGDEADQQGAADSGAGDSGAGSVTDTAVKDAAAKDAAKVDAGCTTAGDCPPSDDPCESARCLATGKCVIVRDCQCTDNADCAPYDNGNACDGQLFCDTGTLPYRCRFLPASLVTCDTSKDTACAAAACDHGSGACALADRPDGTACDDGLACTNGDHCKGGKCQSGGVICPCMVDADCSGHEDGNLCNGTLYCSKAKPLHACVVNPGSVVHCSGKKTACSAVTCVASSGKCADEAAPAGTPCDDGDKCTQGDACAGGKCKAGDVNTCSCKSNKDCGALEDGDACNGTLYCDKAVNPPKCTVNPATVVVCPTVADTGCIKNACFPASGQCQATNVDKLVRVCTVDGDKKVCAWKLRPSGSPAKAVPCDDGDACTLGETCSGGACSGGTDTCGCKADKDCTQKLDNVCAGQLFCNLATGKCAVNPATAVTCKSAGDTDCVKAACAPKTGTCAPTWLGKTKQVCVSAGGQKACRYEVATAKGEVTGLACSDGDACTDGETCAQGKCAGGVSVCTCKTNADCQNPAADKCAGTLFCDKAANKCKLNPATKVVCSKAKNIACLAAVCQPQSGQCALMPANEAHLCDDGDACTSGDLCKAGKCEPGAPVCECWKDQDCATKGDGNACNGTLYCDKGGDKPKCKLNVASIVICNKNHGSPCLKDACNPATGKCGPVATNQAGSCDDGSKCTDADACAAGVCAGKPIKCDDGSACTTDSCAVDKGCVFAKSHCDDGNTCTTDTCDPKSGKCNIAPVKGKSVPCDADKSGCTVGDHCENKACVAGSPIACTLPTKVCQRAVCKPTGSAAYKCVVAEQPKGTPCDDGDACTVGSACAGGACDGAGKDRFYARTYAVPAAWSKDVDRGAWRAVAAAPDGDLVLAGGAWTDNGGQANTRWWVARADAAGAPRWQTTVVGKGHSAAQQAFAAGAGPDASSYAAGTTAGSGGDLNGHIVRFDNKGKQTWDKQYGSTTHLETVAAMVGKPTVDFTLAGSRSAKGLTEAWVQRVAATGAAVWSAKWGAAGLQTQAVALARRPAGSVVVAGWRKYIKGGAAQGDVRELDAKGQLVWARQLGGATPHRLLGVALDKAGAITIAGWHGSDTAPHAWLARLAADGEPRWSDKSQQGARIHGVAATSSGLLTTGSLQPLGGKISARAARRDALGNVRWQSMFAPGDATVGHALSIAGTDGLVIAGSRTDGGKSAGFVARTDHWGHASCKAAGKCLGKAAGACDDGKACTADRCDGAKACVHPAVDQQRCTNNDGCTVYGSCAAGKCPTATNGRLFDRLQHTDAPSAPVRLARMPDGGYVWTGHTNSPGQLAVVVRTDRYGVELWRDKYRIQGLGWGMGVCGLPDGSVVAVSRGFAGAIYGKLRIWDSKGKLLKDSTQLFVFWRPLALFCFADGTFGLGLEYIRYKAYSLHLYKLNTSLSNTWAKNTANLGSYMQKTPPDHLYWPGLAWGFGGDASPDGGAWYAGTVQPRAGGKFRGWIGRYHKTGALAWQQRVGAGGSANDYILDIASTPSSGAVAGGLRSPHGTGSAAWLIALDKAGKTLWQTLHDKPHPAQIYGLDVAADGAIVAAGLATVTAQHRLWLTRVLPDGKVAFARTFKYPGIGSDTIALPGGDIVFVGRDQTKGTAAQYTRLVRTDAWGHSTCTGAGLCGAKKLADCDDAKACTVDACVADKGCVHTPIAGCK